MVGVTTRRTPQAVRTARTRHALLDATVACLVEDGYLGTTGVAVARRAGLSRGAQLHHFGTRDELVVAAVEHLSRKRLDRVRRELGQLDRHSAQDDANADPDGKMARRREALRLLADALSGPLYAATLELWVAARSSTELRQELMPAEERVNKELAALCRQYVTADPLKIRLTLDLLLGRGVSGLLTPHGRRHQNQLLDEWATMLEHERVGEDA
jgi:AcrR family transcriptional regulator